MHRVKTGRRVWVAGSDSDPIVGRGTVLVYGRHGGVSVCIDGVAYMVDAARLRPVCWPYMVLAARCAGVLTTMVTFGFIGYRLIVELAGV